MSNELQLGLFRWAAKSISQRGFIRSVKVAVSILIDVGFDLRYGTETIKWVDLASLNISPEGKNHGNPYKATKARPLRKLLRSLDLPKCETFVDFGAGKGRVLLIAAQYGFHKCI